MKSTVYCRMGDAQPGHTVAKPVVLFSTLQHIFLAERALEVERDNIFLILSIDVFSFKSTPH